MSLLDEEAVQRAIRIPLAVTTLLVTLGALALVPITLGLTLPPALITGALTAWLFQASDEEPSTAVTNVLRVGLALFAAEVLFLVVLAIVGPSD